MLCLFGKGREKRLGARFSAKNQLKSLTSLIFEQLSSSYPFAAPNGSLRGKTDLMPYFFCHPFPQQIYTYLK